MFWFLWCYILYFLSIEFGVAIPDSYFNDIATEEICKPTPTTHNGRSSCKGNRILGGTVRPDGFKWFIEQHIGSKPDYAFCIYANRSEVLKMNGSNFVITPRLIDEVVGPDFVTQPFDLGDDCTDNMNSLSCKITPDSVFILPPVFSGKISTKGKFSFKYGVVEVKAKLPEGDWLYPEIYLNPVDEFYGPGYQSGQIRIAFVPGNPGWNRTLSGGLILGDSKEAKKYGIRVSSEILDWSNTFNRFGLTWRPGKITLSINDKVYGRIYPPGGGFASLEKDLGLKNAAQLRIGTTLAPFDREMYISLGVGVGGFNFEDRTDGTKPWRNGERLSMRKFHQNQHRWKSTWNERSSLEVEHVKVWAL